VKIKMKMKDEGQLRKGKGVGVETQYSKIELQYITQPHLGLFFVP
jgi:hypothetical protein